MNLMDREEFQIFEKMLSSAQDTTKVLVEIKDTLKDQAETLKSVDSHFTNGFKQEIMSGISENNTQIKGIKTFLKSPALWLTLILAFISVVGLMTGVAVALLP